MSAWWKYEWSVFKRACKETSLKALGGSFLLGLVAYFLQWQFGLRRKEDTVVYVLISVGLAFSSVLCNLFFRLLTVPSKMAKEQAKFLEELQGTHKQQMEALSLSHKAEIESAQREIVRLKAELNNYAAKLKVTATLVEEHTNTLHGLLTVKVLNSGNKIARVRRVAVLLARDKEANPQGVEMISAVLELQKSQTIVDIKPDDDMREWHATLRSNPHFEIFDRDGEQYGKGYIELTSEEKVEFEFLLLPDSSWNEIAAPIFNGKRGRKCPHCNFTFLDLATATGGKCPNCQLRI